MITVKQLKAARALLGWSQQELGEHAGLSQTAIANIETMRHRPTEAHLRHLREACETAGIQFIEGGVRERSDFIKFISGPNYRLTMIDYIFAKLVANQQSEYLVSGVDTTLLTDDELAGVAMHVQRLQAAGLSQRVLVREGTKAEQVSGPPSWYRALPAAMFSATTPCFVFADRYAMMLYDKQQVVIIRNAALADDQKRKFNMLWENAKTLES